jgi:hypothetical protein
MLARFTCRRCGRHVLQVKPCRASQKEQQQWRYWRRFAYVGTFYLQDSVADMFYTLRRTAAVIVLTSRTTTAKIVHVLRIYCLMRELLVGWLLLEG